MKKAENHENHPRRSWALNHMGNPSLLEEYKVIFEHPNESDNYKNMISVVLLKDIHDSIETLFNSKLGRCIENKKWFYKSKESGESWEINNNKEAPLTVAPRV